MEEERNKPVKLGIRTGRNFKDLQIKQLDGSLKTDFELGRKDFKQYFAELVAARIVRDWDNLVEYTETTEGEQMVQRAIITILGKENN